MPSTPVRDTANSKSARMPTRVFRMQKNPARTRRRPKAMTSRHVSQETTREQHPAEKCPFENFPHHPLRLWGDNKRGKSPSTRPDDCIDAHPPNSLATTPKRKRSRSGTVTYAAISTVESNAAGSFETFDAIAFRGEEQPERPSEKFPMAVPNESRRPVSNPTSPPRHVRAPGSLPGRPHRAAAGFPAKRPPSDSPMFRSRTAKKRIREGIIATVF